MNYFNTCISYGLTDEEYTAVSKLFGNESRLNLIKCTDFNDVLAIPAGLLFIRFSNLEEQQLESFEECFFDSDAAIFAFDEEAVELGVHCYDASKFTDEDSLQWAVVMRVIIALEKRVDVEMSSKNEYCAVDIEVKPDALCFHGRRVVRGKVQSKDGISTCDLDAFKTWVGDSYVTVWGRFKGYTDDGESKTFDKREISEKLIDMHLLSGSEFPALAVSQSLRERVDALVSPDKNMSNCDLIAHLAAIIIYYREN